MLEENESDPLYSQQVEQLYSLSPVGIIASLVNGPILTLYPMECDLSWRIARLAIRFGPAQWAMERCFGINSERLLENR